MNRLVLVVVSYLVVGCSQVLSSESRQIDASKTPLEFLEDLCKRDSGRYSLQEAVTGWVKESDVRQLIELVDSNKPCASVALTASSYIRLDSTMGDEAAFLIEGFRKGSYPPALNSESLSEDERAEMKRWWGQREKGMDRRPPDFE